MASGRADSQIAIGYLAGERHAARVIDDHIEHAFRRWSHRFGFETADILSDCRYKIYISLRRNEFAYEASLGTYINRIVNHTCIDYIRFRNRVTAVDLNDVALVDEAETADQEVDRKERGQLLVRVLRMLPRECITLWRMSLNKGLKYREIAELVGKSEKNVRRRMWECRDTARKYRDILEKRLNLSELSSPVG